MRPVLVEWQNLSIHALPFFIGLALAIVYELPRRSLLKNNLPLKGFNIFYIQGLFWAWIGAKIFFLIHSAPHNIQSHIFLPSFWMGGGLVFHGGCLFVLIFIFFYVHIFKCFPTQSLRFFIPPICFAQAIGRIGCFLSGCCYGIPFTNGTHRHPVQLYESLGVIVLGLITSKLVNKKADTVTVGIFYLGGYATFRFVLEFFRGDAIRGVYGGVSAAQYFTLVVVGIILLMSRYARVSS